MNRLKELRIERGLSQAALGKILGCAPSTVSKYELSQRELDIPTINRLCDIFHCSSDYLLGRISEPYGQLPVSQAEKKAALYQQIYDLSPEEQAMVDAFVAGLRASRKNK